MASEPVILWENAANNANLGVGAGWQVGTVKADTESPVLKVRIWNGKGTGTQLSNAQGCSLYVLDKNQAKAEPIVKDGWIQGKCVSAKQSSFTVINAVAELPVGAANMGDQEISGKVNNGQPTAVENFAEVDLKVVVPPNAMYGDHPFSVVLKYYYV